MTRNVYVELDYNDGSPQTRTFSIRPDENSEGLLMRPLTFSVKVRTWVQNESTSSGVSKIIISNAGGNLDSFANETFTECRIKENIDGTITTLVTGQVDRVVLNALKFMEVYLKDATKLLDIPLQDDFFPASETSDTGSGTNTYYALEGQPRPIVLGRCKSVKPVLAKRSNNEYHVHDDTVNSIGITYDRGVVVTHTDHTKGFTLAVDPVGVIVADVRGANKVGLSSDARTIDDIFEWIFDKVSFTGYSTSDLTSIDSEKGYRFNYYQDNVNNRSVKDIVKWFLDSMTGWFYSDASGDIRFGYLQEPSLTADVEIYKNNVVDGVKVFDDNAPNITTKFGAEKSWYIYQSDDIASGATTQNKTDLAQAWRYILDGANTLDQFYTSTDDIFDSLIQVSTEGQEEIDNITSLYSQRRKFYTFDSTITAEIGQTVALTYPRYGLDSGVNLLVVGKVTDFIDNTYRLTLWG